MKKEFELIILTIERDLSVLAVGLEYIQRFFRPDRTTIIASARCIQKARELGISDCAYIDEDEVVPGLTLEVMRFLIAKRGGDSSRAGWYFKQILNLAFSLRPATMANYLTWDADTIPLRPLEFFDTQGRTLFTTKTEHHAAYFNTLEKLIGVGKKIDRSFIAEHMMFDKVIVQGLLEKIAGEQPVSAGLIAQRIIEAIPSDQISGSGFAEYETYGTYLYSTNPAMMAFRELSSTRHGTALARRPPSRASLFSLSKRYYWASFEAWPTSGLLACCKRALRRCFGSCLRTAALIFDAPGYARFLSGDGSR